MSTRNFDSSLLTQRRRDKIQAGFFNAQQDPIGGRPNIGYGAANPQTGNSASSALMNVKDGSISFVNRGWGATIVDPACACPTLNAQSIIPPLE